MYWFKSDYRPLLLSFIVFSLLASPSVEGHNHLGESDQKDDNQYIELSHLINNQTLHWISLRDVSYQILVSGEKPRSNKNGTYYVKSDRLEIDLHSGTHMDAPIHFAQDKWSIEQIPLDRLLNVPAYIIDLSEKCKEDRDYEFTRDDIIEFEKDRHMEIARNSLVIIYTGFSELWHKGESEYFGTATRESSSLQIPGFTREAALFLVHEREVIGVGLDAPSADGSRVFDRQNNMDPIAHEIFNSANVYIIENINSNLKKLIDQPNVKISTLPLPIESASGSPIRLIAQLRANWPSQSAPTSPAATATLVSFDQLIHLQLITIVVFMINNIYNM